MTQLAASGDVNSNRDSPLPPCRWLLVNYNGELSLMIRIFFGLGDRGLWAVASSFCAGAVANVVASEATHLPHVPNPGGIRATQIDTSACMASSVTKFLASLLLAPVLALLLQSQLASAAEEEFAKA
nr:unnamed protein product [Digitaria exilis]